MPEDHDAGIGVLRIQGGVPVAEANLLLLCGRIPLGGCSTLCVRIIEEGLKMHSWLQGKTEAELIGAPRSFRLPSLCGVVNHSPLSAGLGYYESTYQPEWGTSHSLKQFGVAHG